jgi:hypothetical protein
MVAWRPAVVAHPPVIARAMPYERSVLQMYPRIPLSFLYRAFHIVVSRKMWAYFLDGN